MDEYDYDEYGDYEGGWEASSGVEAFLREQLAHTPWWAVSLSVHLFVILIVLPMIECKRPRAIPPIKLGAELIEELPEPIKEEKEVVDPSPLDNPQLPKVPDAVVPDKVVPEESGDPNDPTVNAPQGDPDNRSSETLQHKSNNGAIGLGASAGGPYGQRIGGGKGRALKAGGGTPGVMRATDRGLEWLKNHQSPSGKWDSDGFQAMCRKNTCSGVGKQTWVDSGLTGLATLAFLGAGHTHRYGRYKTVVRKALRYLTTVQHADGLVGPRREHYMYNHAICTLALNEAYLMTKSPLVRGAAVKATRFLVQAQNPGLGWRYHARSADNDISVTGWCVMALKAARTAKLPVQGLTEAFTAAETFVESVTDESYYISGYTKKPPRNYQGPTSSRFEAPEIGIDTGNSHAPNHTPTAIATMCRVFFGRSKTDPRLRGGAIALASMLPQHDTGGSGKLSKVDYYYWYYGTIAMFQMGGDFWAAWNAKMKRALVDTQRIEGDECGSWDPHGAWCFAGGRVYATAINVLTLEIYYRYPKAFR